MMMSLPLNFAPVSTASSVGLLLSYKNLADMIYYIYVNRPAKIRKIYIELLAPFGLLAY